MSDHTKGKLELLDDGAYFTLRIQDSYAYTIFHWIHSNSTDPVRNEELREQDEHHEWADARRLVACWNACEGLPTSELEDIAANGEGPNNLVLELARIEADARALARLCRKIETRLPRLLHLSEDELALLIRWEER